MYLKSLIIDAKITFLDKETFFSGFSGFLDLSKFLKIGKKIVDH